jgi:hypothetical protein
MRKKWNAAGEVSLHLFDSPLTGQTGPFTFRPAVVESARPFPTHIGCGQVKRGRRWHA